ncbi:threonine ammonia-lyase IlvA [Ectobacillus panaciterrae]|uniref:threonine ammonia-lyase IlvA n=1 Tax=Ectobacillus panaciterrae TaxID=363872 RepID=UPI0004193D1A|nr:threonine ammonia-lyase IlvA [Ectobacillus panaciterrae]
MRDVKEAVKIEDILVAHHMLKDVVHHTPLQRDSILSEKYDCNVYLKREDLQVVRSFKIRGAYNCISHLTSDQMQKGVVCASAGNHAQGVAYTCRKLNISAKIFMPNTTPSQKVSQVRFFGGDVVEVILKGDTFDSSYSEAVAYCEEHGLTFIHPFDNQYVIAGQGTIGVEIFHDIDRPVDYVFAGIGGGGLVAGVGTYVKGISPGTKMIGVEPAGAASMKEAIGQEQVVTLPHISSFVDGAAVKRVGNMTYDICKYLIDDIVVVPEGKVCTTILELYDKNAIVAEPAGALSIAALEFYREQIRGKTVVCVISGGNNDIDRMQEIKERSLMHEGLKYYFIINFPQRPRALREFLDNVLGPTDDITRFEYTKKNNKDNGPALVGIELQCQADYEPLVRRMEEQGVQYMEINQNPALFNLLI